MTPKDLPPAAHLMNFHTQEPWGRRVPYVAFEMGFSLHAMPWAEADPVGITEQRLFSPTSHQLWLPADTCKHQLLPVWEWREAARPLPSADCLYLRVYYIKIRGKKVFAKQNLKYI